MKKLSLKLILTAIFVSVVLIVSFKYNQKSTEVSYTTFLSMLNSQEINQVILNNSDTITFFRNDSTEKFVTDNPRIDNFKETLLLNNVAVKEQATESIISNLVFLGFVIVAGGYFIKNKTKSKSESMVLEEVKASEDSKNVLSFDNMAGNEEAKESVSDVIDFIKNPEKYSKYGAKMPRGLIFYGPPGTGKTLMAKALAGEAGVPFYAVSGSDFVQKYVGVGAGRIRDLFKKARKSEKAVIFIDEIDAIGKKRSGDASSSNDERDQTLNALLTEMSGFSSTDGIVVIAATNRLDTLDDALLRPGRFDRHVEIALPDINARLSILNHYLKNKPVDETLNVNDIAKQTVYFSGAMIENLINEASINAAKSQSDFLTMEHIDKAYYTIVAGAEKKDKSSILSSEKEITSFHEAGHALVTKLLMPQNSVAKVTIIPSTKGVGGFSLNIATEKSYYSKKEIENQIMVCFAGRAAEELAFGTDNITTGASNDIEKATKLIKDYVSRFGMSDNLGLLNTNYFKNDGDIMRECKDLLNDLYQKTIELLKENYTKLENIKTELLIKETLNEEQLDKLIA